MNVTFTGKHVEKHPGLAKKITLILLPIFMASLYLFLFTTGPTKGIGFLIVYLSSLPLLAFGSMSTVLSVKEVEYTIDDEKIFSRFILSNAIGQMIADFGSRYMRFITSASPTLVHFKDVVKMDEETRKSQQVLVLSYKYGLRRPIYPKFIVFLPDKNANKLAELIKSKVNG